MDVAEKAIAGIFPGADQDRSALFDKRDLGGVTAFRIGKHFILLHPNPTGYVLKMEWKAGGRWVWNVEAAKVLDDYHPRTYDDLIGWVSYVWECVCSLAQSTIQSQIEPHDLLPGGFKKGSSASMLNTAAEVLTQCGKAPHEIVRYVADTMRVDWKFNKDRTAMLFHVNSSTNGKVVGRIGPAFMKETPLEWGYEFPIGWDTVKRKGTLSFKDTGSEFIPRAQKLLQRLYVKAVFDFINVVIGKNEIKIEMLTEVP